MLLMLTVMVLMVTPSLAGPEPGVWTVTIDEVDHVAFFTKVMYKGSKISLSVSCDSYNVKIPISWYLRRSPCASEYQGISPNRAEFYRKFPNKKLVEDLPYDSTEYLKGEVAVQCEKETEVDFNIKARRPIVVHFDHGEASNDAVSTTSELLDKETGPVWKDGNYLFVLFVDPFVFAGGMKLKVTVRMHHEGNYISVTDFPVHVFNGVMGLVLFCIEVLWCVRMVQTRKDTRTIHLLFQLVFIFGILRSAMMFADYQVISETGELNKALHITSEIMWAIMATLILMLILYISYGCHIIYPKMGYTWWKMAVAGFMQCSLLVAIFCMSTFQTLDCMERRLVTFTLVIIVLIIFAWTVYSMSQTYYIFKSRKDDELLTLYRRICFTLVFALCVFIGMMYWTLVRDSPSSCSTINDVYWSSIICDLLQFIVIFSLAFLWRPRTVKNRYEVLEHELDTGKQ